MILQPKLLGNFWQTFQPGKGLELRDLVQLVESPYGQLTVFDPRLPHGVRPVSGTRDPQQVCAGASTVLSSSCRLTGHLTLGLHLPTTQYQLQAGPALLHCHGPY